ncbi:MAG: sulfatase-like hydrolase/transferase [Planctomycetota bacterium]
MLHRTVIAVALLSAGIGPSAWAASGPKPNIVLILADDLSPECLGCYGSETFATPRLDGLAREGVRFTRAYSCPMCVPSRVEIMTGVYSHRNFVAGKRATAKQRETTLGQMLKSQGYRTCFVGKYTMPPQSVPRLQEAEAGFDDWLQKDGGTYYDPTAVVQGKRSTLEGRYSPDVLADYAVAFIEKPDERPFFLYYAMNLPHLLNHWPPGHERDGRAVEKLSAEKMARGGKKQAEVSDLAAEFPMYVAMVSYLDACVGRVIDSLEVHGLRENTLILFVGDNGSPSFQIPFQGSTFRGGKGRLDDSGTRVPVLASWKGHGRPGIVCEDLVDLTDFYATLAAAAGAPASATEGKAGVSFLSQVTGQAGVLREWAFLFGCINNGAPMGYWARDLRWKLYHDGRLYDTAADPAERRALRPADDTAETAAARAKLEAVLSELQVNPTLLERTPGKGTRHAQ